MRAPAPPTLPTQSDGQSATSVGDALAALEAWGVPVVLPRLIVDRENAVYDVTLAGGQRAALRLHRAGYRPAVAIDAELRWADGLAAAGFPCPRPVATEAGPLVSRAPCGRLASLVSWVEARPFAEADPQPDLYRRLGALIAQLHDVTDSVAPAQAGFPAWSTDALVGPEPIWGRFWENPTLSPAERRLLESASVGARARLDARIETDHGLIHADLLPDNILDDGRRLWIIDFDDCGLGDRTYDLGTALVSVALRPDFPDLAAALIGGYASRRGNPARLAADVPLFVALRAFASCGWVMGRTPEGDPRRRAYAERAVRLAERLLARPAQL